MCFVQFLLASDMNVAAIREIEDATPMLGGDYRMQEMSLEEDFDVGYSSD